MKHNALYPGAVKVTGQSFKECKKLTVPNQAMSLREIITRFTRKESLPVEMAGVYFTGLGDLEKLHHEDISYRLDRAYELKKWVQKEQKIAEEKKQKEELAAKAAEQAARAAETVKSQGPGGEPFSAATPPKGA